MTKQTEDIIGWAILFGWALIEIGWVYRNIRNAVYNRKFQKRRKKWRT